MKSRTMRWAGLVARVGGGGGEEAMHTGFSATKLRKEIT